MNESGLSEVRALREAYTAQVVHVIAGFQEIEEMILDLENLEELVGEGLYHNRARRFRERMNTLRLRIRAAERQVHRVIDQAVANSHYVSLAVVLYKKKLKQQGIDGSRERTAAQVAVLNPVSIRARQKSEERRARRAKLKAEVEQNTASSGGPSEERAP